MSDLYSIGEFSRMSRLSIKALRLYDEQGVLKPGHTDRFSGYRYYSSAQLAEADLVRRLRVLEVPLDGIREFLREPEGVRRLAMLEEHLGRMEERLRSYRSIVASTRSLVRAMVNSRDTCSLAAMMWIAEKGYRPAGPGQAEDPADYRTEVICPVEG